MRIRRIILGTVVVTVGLPLVAILIAIVWSPSASRWWPY